MGQGHPWWEIPAMIAFAIVLFGVPAWLILKLIRWIKKSAEQSHGRAFEGLSVSRDPQPGDVRVVFHTYYGLIAYVTQTEFRFWASPDDARTALKRLHRSNLAWGFFAYGALFIPVVSYLNLLMQRSSIRKQERLRAPIKSGAPEREWEIDAR